MVRDHFLADDADVGVFCRRWSWVAGLAHSNASVTPSRVAAAFGGIALVLLLVVVHVVVVLVAALCCALVFLRVVLVAVVGVVAAAVLLVALVLLRVVLVVAVVALLVQGRGGSIVGCHWTEVEPVLKVGLPPGERFLLPHGLGMFVVGVARPPRRQLALESFEAPTWAALARGARHPPTHNREMGEPAPARALLRSQSGPCVGRASTAPPTSEPTRVPPAELRVLLLRRLRLDLPFTASARRCRARLDSRGDDRAACPTAGVLRKGKGALEKAAARSCREAGARVAENQFLQDLHVDGVGAGGGRRLEVIANCLRRKGSTYPELLDARRCQLVVVALGAGGQWQWTGLASVAQRAFAASLLHLPLDGPACDGDEPWLQDVMADARHTEAHIPSPRAGQRDLRTARSAAKRKLAERNKSGRWDGAAAHPPAGPTHLQGVGRDAARLP
ncbi:unnamed protein product, partial [Prorocentrum cordatum]